MKLLFDFETTKCEYYHKKMNVSTLGCLSCSGGDSSKNAFNDTFEVIVVVVSFFLSKIF